MHAPSERRSPLVGLSSALLAAALVFATSGAGADAPTLEALVAMGEAVRGTDAPARAEAIAAFGALGDDAFAALEARVLAMRRERRTAEEGYRAIDAFGRAVGATGPNQDVDVVRGLTLVLDGETTAVHRRVAERVLVLRALERIGTARAVIAMLPLLTSDMATYRWYARHMVRRMGRVAAAALVLAAQHPAPDVDLFAGWAFAELGITDAGHAVQDQSAESLAEILRAYSGIKHLGAMPVVASFVGDDRAIVRAAAHDGMLSYAENGIWQLRSLHQSRLGRPAGEGASFRDLLARIEAHAEDRRTAPFRARIALAEQAFAAGRLEEAVRLANDVEARAQGAAGVAQLAPIHAAAADAALARGELDQADEALRRALLLDPNHAAAPTWSTRRDELETERLARLGVEPWPDAPQLAPSRAPPSRPARLPFALGGLGLFVLVLPALSRGLSRVRGWLRSRDVVGAFRATRDRTRTRVLGRYARVVSVFVRRALTGARSAFARGVRDAADGTTMKPDESSRRPSAPSQAVAAEVARTRLSLAAEAARARLGVTGISVPLPSTTGNLATNAREAAREPDADEVTLRGVTAPEVDDLGVAPCASTETFAPTTHDDPRRVVHVETTPLSESLETAQPTEAVTRADLQPTERLAVAQVVIPASARHERPKRRASLSPELVFGTATKASKRSAR